MTFPVVGSNIPGPYQISNSLRFNDGDSPTLSRTPASTGNRKTWTFSYWIKRSTISTVQQTFAVGTNAATPWFLNYINSDDTLHVWFHDGTNSYFSYGLNQLRDVSAWYHIMYVVDTTQSTASDRLKVYINGSEMTWNTYAPPAQNFDTQVNTTNTHYIGRAGNGQYFDGYIAETYFIDGQALSPTDFGEFDEDSGVWKPKQYEGTYGTNGFYLKFNNTGNMGQDSSGNDNTWTPTNLSGTTDVTTDTPTNNFATWNALDKSTSVPPTLSEGNTTLSQPASGLSSNTTLGVSSGQWYFECEVTGGSAWLGVVPQNLHPASSNLFTASNTAGVYGINPNLYLNGSLQGSLGGGVSNGDILMIAFDIDNGNFYVGKNGLWNDGLGGGFDQADFSNATAHSFTVKTGDNYVVGTVNGSGSSSYVLDINFGNPSFSISSGNSDDNGYGNFEYAPPSGYLALCTQNLATELSPTIDDGSAYFQTLTFTGNGGTQTLTFDGNSDLQADFMWFKERNLAANWHQLWDTSRGATVASSKRFYSNASSADDNITTGAGVRGVGTNTVEVGATAGINGSSQPLVLWAWKANGGTTSSNTDGTITSTVQANTTAGFSIVTYTGTGSNATVGHGLGVKPDMVIVKGRSSTENWGVQMANTLGFTNALRLNLTDAYGGVNGAGWWNDIAPTSTTVSIGTRSEVNTNGNNYIMYCFNNVEGYSKFGKYTGNGSTNGTFIYTGFRPSWIMLKRTDSGASWLIFDNKRVGYNLVSNRLYANDPQGEDTSTSSSLDLLSNGFKIRSTTAGDSSTNASGGTYIYMVFAENPFVTSGAVPVTAR